MNVTGKKTTRRARPVDGSTKYGKGDNKMLDSSSLNLTQSQRTQLADLTSLSLTKKTWANYRTAEKMLAKCCRSNGIRKELPVSEETVIIFILWLAYDKGVKASTISNYLAGVRQLHIRKGVDPPKIRTERVTMALKGKEHEEQAKMRTNEIQERQPVTPDILLLLKARLRGAVMDPVDQRLIWAVCTICFFGAFRGAELLCRTESQFDPAYTLLAEDVCLVGDKEKGEQSLQLRIKDSKESKKGKTVIVDVFQSREDICPVQAFQKWCAMKPPIERGQPAFRWVNGAPLTSRRLNQVLKDRLSGYLEGANRFYTTHSFRGGAASMMGLLGYTDEEIKAMGKWTSSAFERYVKLPRSKRRAVAKDFCGQFRK